MTIDFWGLGLQAVNVLILVWLLSRVFWRPVAAAIATRQETAKTVMQTAKATKADADAALTEATQARAGIAEERTAILDAARQDAEAAAKAVLAEARTKADAMLAAANAVIAKSTEAAQKANAAQASDLSLKISARLLERLNGPAVQAAFLSQLLAAISKMPAADRTALAASPTGVEIIMASDLGPDKASEQDKIRRAVQAALGGSLVVQFVIDPNLIGGLELRSPHFVLHNSWQADLSDVRKAVKDAA